MITRFSSESLWNRECEHPVSITPTFTLRTKSWVDKLDKIDRWSLMPKKSEDPFGAFMKYSSTLPPDMIRQECTSSIHYWFFVNEQTVCSIHYVGVLLLTLHALCLQLFLHISLEFNFMKESNFNFDHCNTDAPICIVCKKLHPPVSD